MPINPDAVGATGPAFSSSWTSRLAAVLLGVGAGVADLSFTTENSQNVTQRALPTIGVTLANVNAAFAHIGTFNPAMLVHGEQRIECHREIPVSGTVSTVSTVTGIFDKGKGAVAEITGVSTLEGDTDPLFTVVMAAFIRGEGGFGGDRGPSGPRNEAPDRAPDHEITYDTRADQALIYRLSGDRNPLHSDPEFAKLAGFDRPILHGLCTYGFTGRALLATLCDDDPARFASMEGRFSSPVFPGESLTIRIWQDGDSAVFQTTGQDGRVVLDSGAATIAA